MRVAMLSSLFCSTINTEVHSMDEIAHTLQGLDNLAQTKKQNALNERDKIIEEQTMLRNRWRGG